MKNEITRDISIFLHGPINELNIWLFATDSGGYTVNLDHRTSIFFEGTEQLADFLHFIKSELEKSLENKVEAERIKEDSLISL